MAERKRGGARIMEIKYKSSNGKEYNLVGNKMRATDGYLHKYEWKPSFTPLKHGVDIYDFEKEAAIYQLTLSFRGGLSERKRALDELTEAFEYDIANRTPGRIYYGEYYIDCYITSLNDKVSEIWNNWTEREIDIYCPYPSWVQEVKKSFYPSFRNKGEEYDFLDYPYIYNYDYSKPEVGTQHWLIEHYQNSNFEMIIYGACSNPRIVIAGHVYQILDTLEDGEYVIVNSRDKTITKHLRNGTVQNIFTRRRKDSSVFEQIPAGGLLVNWNGEFGFDITVYKERSAPKWS